MPTQKKRLRSQRKQTDESLRVERQNADSAAERKRSLCRDDADGVLDRAQQRADALLEAARQKADDEVMTSATVTTDRSAATDERRARADEQLGVERAQARALLLAERTEHRRMLATLLPLERAKTDRDLLTERARSDDMLASRDNFVEMVSHDLRNLLCDIMLEASLLAEGASDSEEGQRIVDGMHRFERSAARMRGLIGDLVDVVSIDAGKLSVRPARGDVSALLHEAVEMFGPAARKQAMVLRCECDDQVLWAQFDGHRMLQVLANLLTNALKFTPRGGTIVVRGERSGDGVLVSVTDTGMGIPSDQIENVFKRFWQVAEDDRRGLGLGLYICRCIIDAHGGKIWAESRPGGGSSFLAMLPAAVSQVA